jgi:hypothetical protein
LEIDMNEQKMYGCDLAAFLESLAKSSTYRFSGANMVVAGLMSDAQEQMAFGDVEGARKTLNLAKAVLFQVMDGALSGDAPVAPLIDKRTAAALQGL